jgi:hypothetical protein
MPYILALLTASTVTTVGRKDAYIDRDRHINSKKALYSTSLRYNKLTYYIAAVTRETFDSNSMDILTTKMFVLG